MRIATLDTSRAPEFLHTVQLVNFAFPVTRFSLAAAALIVSKPSHVGYRFDFAITVPHREDRRADGTALGDVLSA